MTQMLNHDQLQEAISLLQQPGQVAISHIEGRFVLLGRAYDAQAAARINEIKARSAGRPLVMCFPNLTLAKRAHLSSPLLSLLPYFQDRVTISIPAPPEVSIAAHRGVGMIGVRWITAEPLSQVMLTLDEPLLISSANPTGRPSARHIEDLQSYGMSQLPLIGELPVASEPSILRRATVVGLANSGLRVLSPGDTSLSEIKAEWDRLKYIGEVLLG